MRTAAKTPRSNCLMSSAKLAAAGIQLTEVHDAVRRSLRDWQTA
jgi:UDP-glucose 4,6-dehydratase/3,5-epimerase/4-reductase